MEIRNQFSIRNERLASALRFLGHICICDNRTKLFVFNRTDKLISDFNLLIDIRNENKRCFNEKIIPSLQ